ncbi:MAG: protein kinase, partial [Actinomycetota bacterium]
MEIQHLTFTDDGERVLDDACFDLPAGSKTCIVGSTGRDQAALLALILGLYRGERGNIMIDGVDVASLPLDDSRNTMALVLADPWLRQGSLADNIIFGHPGVTKSELQAVGDLIGFDDLLDGLIDGYEATVIAENGRQVLRLTDGQRRRIALARALIRNPGVLLFEEPTTGLGTDEERHMIRAIDVASHGRTTLMATHRLNLARRCDAVLVIEDGRVVPYQGSTNGKEHAELWDLQVPPVVAAGDHSRSHLRLIKPNDPPTPQPINSPWGVTIGTELAPGYLASGLLSRNTHTETWVAWSVEREEPVRVKIPRENPVTYPAFEQLFREFKVLQRCDHPGLAASYGADLDAEMPYAVFEYLDSNSLAKVSQRRGEGMEALDILYAGFELAGAINYLHQRGLVHLNLRASCVRTREDTIVITDFGSALPIGAELPRHAANMRGRRIERRFYAPEFLPGRAADPKMDVYALGALMHRATAGSVLRAASGGVGLAPYRSLTKTAPAPMPELIDAMLAPDPADRPEAEEILS